MKFLPLVLSAVLLSSLSAFGGNGDIQTYQMKTPYPVETLPAPDAPGEKVKNIILMIGDGMGLPTLFSARAANGGNLHISQCPVTGLSLTSSADKLVTDSAASGTAMATGSKTRNGRLAVDAEGKTLDSLIDAAANASKSTGVAVTSRLNDATPAAFCAQSDDRGKDLDIAACYPDSRADFIFGGGAKHFENRPDGRNIFREMEKKGYTLARNREELEKAPSGKLFAVVADTDLPRPEKRGDLLQTAVQKALNTLSENPRGFFLMIEGSKIDKAAHKNDLAQTMEETFDFDKTAGLVLKWASAHPGTLVVITADHSTGGLVLLDGHSSKGEIKCRFITTNHNGTAVPVYAYGPGSGHFTGVYENTAIFHKLNSLMAPPTP